MAFEEQQMNTQRTHLQKPSATVLPCMIGIGLFVCLGNAHAAVQVPCPLASASTALHLVASIALAAVSQTMEATIFNQQCILQNLWQMVASSWLVLALVAAAVLLRAVFAGKVGD
jgi:hypothetical protein